MFRLLQRGMQYMNKKIILIITLFFSLTWPLMNSSAVFYDNESKYEKIKNSDSMVTYFDKYSVTAIRYDPPYYVMGFDLVSRLFDFGENGVPGRTHYKVFYNINTKDASYQRTYMAILDDDGNVIQDFNFSEEEGVMEKEKLIRDSAIYIGADKAFYQYYGIHFFPNVDETIFHNNNNYILAAEDDVAYYFIDARKYTITPPILVDEDKWIMACDVYTLYKNNYCIVKSTRTYTMDYQNHENDMCEIGPKTEIIDSQTGRVLNTYTGSGSKAKVTDSDRGIMQSLWAYCINEMMKPYG